MVASTPPCPRVARAGLLAAALACASAAGCASGPPLTALCGTWQAEGAVERWWPTRDGLAGEGRAVVDGVEVPVEALSLRRTRTKLGARAVYRAEPVGQAPAEFAPIDPSAARFGPKALWTDGVRWSWADYTHDFPQEIHYRITDDRLDAVVSGPDRESGWTFTRTAACADTP